MNEGSIGRRYAQALLSIAREEGLTDRLGEDLSRFLAYVHKIDAEGINTAGGSQQSVTLSNVLFNPTFTRSERRAVLERILPSQGLHTHTERFLFLLLEKGRLSVFPDIVREYQRLADQDAGRLRATVTSATPLVPAMQVHIATALSRATGKHVIIETKVDSSLIGGIVAQVGGRVYDASIRTRLEQLALDLAASSHTSTPPIQA